MTNTTNTQTQENLPIPTKQEIAYIRKMHGNVKYRCDHSLYYKNVFVCDEWLEFDSFLQWVINQPLWDYENRRKLSISRHMDTGNYHPANCHITLKSENKPCGIWSVTDLCSGETNIIFNLAKFAREREYNYGKLYRAYQKPSHQSDHFKVVKLEIAA